MRIHDPSMLARWAATKVTSIDVVSLKHIVLHTPTAIIHYYLGAPVAVVLRKQDELCYTPDGRVPAPLSAHVPEARRVVGPKGWTIFLETLFPEKGTPC
jgi:hypothetical protein